MWLTKDFLRSRQLGFEISESESMYDRKRILRNECNIKLVNRLWPTTTSRSVESVHKHLETE